MSYGVIFDMDGVLIDSGPAHYESWKQLARQHGIEVTDEQFSHAFGRPSRDIIRTLWGNDVSDDDIARYDAEKERLYREIVHGNLPLMPGVRDALAGLKDAGYTMAVATSGPRENLELVLDEGGLRPFFAATVTGFDIEHGKPAPDCFLLAADRINLQPADCVVVEDAPVGIKAGVAAGMPVIALAGTHAADRLTDAGATRVVEQLVEITADLVSDVRGDVAK